MPKSHSDPADTTREMDEEIDACAGEDDSLRSDAFKPEYYIVLQWFLDPLATCKNLGVEPDFGGEDWLSIRQFPFGEVGYKPFEKELIWYIRVNHAEEAAKFFKNFFEVNQIPHAMSDAMSGILAKLDIIDIPFEEAVPCYIYLEDSEASEVAAQIQKGGWAFNGIEEDFPTYCVA
jgi:hypothetical protein